MNLPFAISKDAESYIKHVFSTPPEKGLVPALVFSPRSTVGEQEMGEMVMATFYPKGKRSEDTLIKIFNYEVSMASSTIEALSGTEIVMVEKEISVGGQTIKKNFLVRNQIEVK